jgi:hypothetical protein
VEQAEKPRLATSRNFKKKGELHARILKNGDVSIPVIFMLLTSHSITALFRN